MVIILITDSDDTENLLIQLIHQLDPKLRRCVRLTSADHAINYARSHKTDFLIIDLATFHDPECSIKWIKNAGLAVPIIALGGADPNSLDLAIREGAADYLSHEDLSLRSLQRAFTIARERKQFEHRLTKAVQHDDLTGLPNRSFFFTHLAHAMRCAKRSGTKVGLIYIDLDYFKIINDTYGHREGDSVLKAVAARLQSCVREIETVARIGGDEFVIILEHIVDFHGIRRILDVFLKSLKEAVVTDKNSYHIYCSVGISIDSDEHENGSDFLEHCDAIMYRAKKLRKLHRDSYADAAIVIAGLPKIVSATLPEAASVPKHEPVPLNYQFFVHSSNHAIFACEAIPQPNTASCDLNTLSALATLHRSRTIVEQCKRDLNNWHQHKPNPYELIISLGESMIRSTDHFDRLIQTLERVKPPASRLLFALDESLLLFDERETQLFIDLALTYGYHIIIDHFGRYAMTPETLRHFRTGYVRLFIDQLKLQKAPHDDRDHANRITTLINIIRQSSLTPIATGIASQEDYQSVRRAGCQILGGPYISDMLRDEAIEKLPGGSAIKINPPGSSGQENRVTSG